MRNASEVLETNMAGLYWDKGMLTETISHKRPDITLFEETNQMIYLIDFSIFNWLQHAKFQ